MTGGAWLAGLLTLSQPGTSPAPESLPSPPGTERIALSLEYDRDLDASEKQRAVARTLALYRELGIVVEHSSEAVAELERQSGGRIRAKAVGDPHRLYDAAYYLGDLVRLPPALHPLFRRIVVVEKLRLEDPRGERGRPAALALETRSGTVAVDHSNLNQLELFGNFVHPKVNFAMVLEVALEARLWELGPAALGELGLDIVIDDHEWARLNDAGRDGWAAYSGEDVAFVGLASAARVSPPGILFDAVRELRTGIPADVYRGMPDVQPPWLSPRNGPPADRQSILRCLFSRDPLFFERLGGSGGQREDAVLREKTRLMLYAAFVASGGVLDHGFWSRRHRGNAVVDELTRDFDAAFLARLEERLATSPETRGVTLALPRR